jgi:hypothetical protein
MDSISQPSAKAWRNSDCETRRGPSVPGVASLKQSRNRRPSGLRTVKLAHFVCQPMKGFPAFQNKIWKWDFAPAGDSSGTRKGWRLFAYVPDPNAPEPIPAQAFICYDKDQEPKGNPAKNLAGVLRDFLSSAIAIQPTPDRFRRQTLADERIISICYECYENIFTTNNDEAEIAESTHECPAKPQ